MTGELRSLEVPDEQADVLSPEQRAFIDQLSAFNAQSQMLRGRMNPAQRVQRRARARHMATLAKRLFPGMKVDVT